MANTTSAQPARRRWTHWLKDRWPTALALGMTVVGFGGKESAEALPPLWDALLLMQLGYLVTAKLKRRRRRGR